MSTSKAPTYLKDASIKWAMAHVRKEGDTDLFPKPFEFDIIQKFKKEISIELRKIAINTHVWSGPRRLMVPKSEFAFRPVCQLDPYDSILFAGLVKEIGKRIENARVSVLEKKVFSYRFMPSLSGRLYASSTGWEEFWRVSLAHCQNYSFVLVTDLADFYNQIYHHTIENQLDQCGIGESYWYAIKNLLANLTEGVSRGVPIGPHPSHLLAEMAMIPVDQYLDSMGLTWCRYVDDIHIFCKSRDDGHSALYKLVDYLDRTQKIQINKQKTKIVSIEVFKQICNDNKVDHPINPTEKELLATVKTYTAGPYERVKMSALSPSDIAKVSKNKIESVLKEYLDAPEVDYVRLRWFIRRMTQIGVPGGVELMIKRFDELLPAISEVGNYFEAAAPNFKGNWNTVGKELTEIYSRGVVQASEYLKVVILSLFCRIHDLNHISKLTSMYDSSSSMCQRKIVLAAASAGAAAWLSTHKSTYKNAEPWTKRALIYAMRALPTDERKFWLKSVKSRESGLNRIIADAISK